MDGRGYVQVEDLVRVINMEEGTFYRNRDLYLVFQRMMKRSGSIDQKISINVFLSMLSSKWYLKGLLSFIDVWLYYRIMHSIIILIDSPCYKAKRLMSSLQTMDRLYSWVSRLATSNKRSGLTSKWFKPCYSNNSNQSIGYNSAILQFTKHSFLRSIKQSKRHLWTPSQIKNRHPSSLETAIKMR